MKSKIACCVFASFLFVSSVSAAQPYTVQQGDTLYQIGKRFGVTVEQLKEVNVLSSDALQINQKLNIPDAQATLKKTAYVTPERLNLRVEQNVNSPITGVLNQGQEVEVVESLSEWSKVKVGDKTGFVASEYLSSKPVEASRSLSLMLNRVKTLATSFVGTPYRWGGTTPQGFDCSGFTQYIFSEMGVNLPRVSSSQFEVGSKVTRDDLRVGDLLFFDTLKKGTISHVSIYLGNNKIVHSATKKVEVSDLDWYLANYKFFGAKRVLSAAE